MHLNTFFPFDPYSLPKSRKYIVDAYRDWSEVDPGSDEEEEEEEEDEGDLGEGENSRGAVYKSTAEDGQLPPGRAIPKPSSKEDADFEVSLDAMSISPQHHRPAD
jgi:RNA polymerase I-specific transcription initiation factor RRN3